MVLLKTELGQTTVDLGNGHNEEVEKVHIVPGCLQGGAAAKQ